jgi:hypothetical protein
MRSYAAVVFVSMLSVAAVTGQCTKSFSGLTQCTILNGAPTKDTGMMSLIGYCLHSTHRLHALLHACPRTLPTMNHNAPGHFCSADAALDPAYKDIVAKKSVTDSQACKTAYAGYNCVMIASVMSSAPCDASGNPLLPCHEMCSAYVQACKLGGGISTLPLKSPFFPLCFPWALSDGTSRLRTSRICLFEPVWSC